MTPNRNRTRLKSEEAEAVRSTMSGQDLKALREAIGWTQEDLAKAMGVSVRTLQNREKAQELSPPEAFFVKSLAEKELERLRRIVEGQREAALTGD